MPWQQASIGYVAQPLAAYEKSPVWTATRRTRRTATAMKNMLPTGYAGKLGYASAARSRTSSSSTWWPKRHRVEDAEGSGGAGAEARRALLQGLIRHAQPVTSHGASAALAATRRTRRLADGIRDVASHAFALQNNRNALGLLFMLPAAVLLLLFLTYPLGLGTWLGFTDAKIGRAGDWIGLENYEFLWGDAVTRLALFNTLFYTVVASVIKFGLGLWLALLLNQQLPFKSFFRAIVLLPFIVPTALSAIAFWWIYDSQFSIISWALMKMGLIDQLHRLPRRPVERALLDDRRQRLARRAVRRDHAARRPADDLAVATTRRRRSTARRRGSSSATSRCRC